MIKLNDILRIQDLSNVKIRFNIEDKDYDPIRFFKENRDKLMDGQFWNYEKKKVFKEGDIALGFARIRDNSWLLFDISRITKDHNRLLSVGYDYESIEAYEKYFGRLVIEYNNRAQNLIRRASSVIDQCYVTQILQNTFNDDIFPGYENINLSWHDLKRVVKKDSWKTALENQKGVYLITDESNGKMYIGSAYGAHMILGRWKSYIKTGHGGNKELKTLDFDHIMSHFRYSILDIYKSTTTDEVIIKRESWWKNTLLTRKFGYNHN